MSSLARKLERVSSSLSIRGVFVDSRIFRRAAKAEAVHRNPMRVFDPNVEMPTKDMLTKQVRMELRSRGLDAIGKPWVVKRRLDDAREEEDVGSLVAAVEGLRGRRREEELSSDDRQKKEPTTTTLSADPLGPGSFSGDAAAARLRYAAKLRAKLGGDGVPSSFDEAAGDAAALAAGREAVASFAAPPKGGAFRHGPPGLRTLLHFVRARSMVLALLVRDAADDEVREITENGGATFDVVHDRGDVRGACDVLGLDPARVLALADDDDALLREASRAGALTCLLEDDESLGRRQQQRGLSSTTTTKRADYVVGSCQEVIDVINDLNGISYRATVPVF
eukprot:CAMPEP_0118902268 /NCGR_PEP_ID=MMETSP1166-20130328/7632_1 /TAXON_ID=1104430 /ORGANISM="Chrysoreinhardia sp, Strain CCMP3193" /LENGTH=336 /DNA_ID=CAMNT_0006841473 /DNA_START=11 /DNA_END=1021 /DNA_ORIENTATION=-